MSSFLDREAVDMDGHVRATDDSASDSSTSDGSEEIEFLPKLTPRRKGKGAAAKPSKRGSKGAKRVLTSSSSDMDSEDEQPRKRKRKGGSVTKELKKMNQLIESLVSRVSSHEKQLKDIKKSSSTPGSTPKRRTKEVPPEVRVSNKCGWSLLCKRS